MTTDAAQSDPAGDAATAAPTDPNRIVVGVDGSEPSKLALRWAAKLAAGLGARIEAVTAWRTPSSFGYGYVPETWRPDKDAEKVLTDTVNEVFGDDRPAGLKLVILEGNPAEALVSESEHAQMLVLGNRGHGGFVGLLMGSVSGNAAAHAKCPVLVVH